MKNKIFVLVFLILIGVSFLALASATEDAIDSQISEVTLSVNEESGYLENFNEVNIKLSSIIPVVCKTAPCPKMVDIIVNKKNVLNIKANRFTLSEEESIHIYGISIKLFSVNPNNTATFKLALSKEEEDGGTIPTEGEKIIVTIEYGEEKTKEVKLEVIGEKKFISVGRATETDCREYAKECSLGNNILCEKWETNCKEKNITAETKEEIKIKDNKIYLNGKEVKVMPDTASQKAIETLQLKKGVIIELKDTGKPVYEIVGKKEAKLLGFIKKEAAIKTEISAETGEVISTKKPWWSFLASGV